MTTGRQLVADVYALACRTRYEGREDAAVALFNIGDRLVDLLETKDIDAPGEGAEGARRE